MSTSLNTILRNARKSFKKLDAARKAMREAENELSLLCREFDLVEGTRGIRVEGLRIAADNRLPQQELAA